ncbi:MAG TPA: pyridoxal phosphate-dependent aminotransferase family protein [Anaerolinea sp.]|nr:pyridoxal phosphate-dependent aminotransferase family protein [Anaerolinea sp.]
MKINIEGPIGAKTRINGQDFDYFSGTGYLGLQSHPEVLSAAAEAIGQYGLFTGSSRGGYGEHPLYLALEQEACRFFGAERVVYFASGYLGMSVLTQAGPEHFDHIFIDAAAHFSLWDAAQATNRPITPFHHLRADALEESLRKELSPGERPLVLSDGVFPVSGEISPLPDFLQVVKGYDGVIYLDDAHAVGVLGAAGRGTPDHFGISAQDCRTSATLAKALGGYGGILWGERGWAESIERNSRICAGASPPPLVVAAASARALALARENPQWRETLRENVRLARDGFRGLGWEVADSPSPIICLDGRNGVSLERVRDGLFQKGIAVTLVRGYTSAPPGGGLRIAIMATHTVEQIERLLREMGGLP